MSTVDERAAKATREVVKIIKGASFKQSVYGWGVVGVAVALAALGLWSWVWLVLACAAVRALLDGPLAIVASITGAMMQLAQIDERLKAGRLDQR